MAKANLTKTADVQTAAREVDFATRFAKNWEHLRDIMGIMRQVEKQPGTILKSKYASVTLQSGTVGEGEEIPYSKAEVMTKDYAPIVVEKFAKGVSIEAIQEHGYDDAINMTDKEFLAELQQNVTGRFYDYIKTGTLTSAEASFQSALAMAQGNVRNKWKAMHKGITDVVGFCNILDAYAYLGAANITVQSEFGMNYIENFIGYKKLFLCSDEEIPQGKVIATPVENIVLYFVNPANSDFARAGLPFTTDGETNLIGFHVEGSYKTAVSESYALMGLTLFAEYLDGIAVVEIDSNFLDDLTVATETNAVGPLYGGKVASDLQTNVVVDGDKITGSLKFIEGGLADTGPLAGDGYFIALKWSNIDSDATSLKVGLNPSRGTGLVECLSDPDHNGVFKIADKNSQKFETIVSDGVHRNVQYFDLSGLTLQEA